MGFISPQEELYVPLLQDGEDRFGLPLSPPTLLTSEKMLRELGDVIETLAIDLFESAVRHLGKKEAKILFLEITKEPPKGKQRTHQEHDDLMLKKYDAFVEAYPDQVRFAASRVAADCKEQLQGRGTVDSLTRRLRDLVKKRDREREDAERRLKAMKAVYRLAGPTLLERFDTEG
jgi:hypothetical protein